MFEKTRDLRVAMILTAALLKEDGIAGFRDGVALVKGFIEKLWDQFYPKLDPEDNNDPMIRVNILKGFDGDGSSADLYKFKLRLREAVLTNSKQRIGRFGYRDVQIAKGEIPAPPQAEGQAPPADMALINAAFEDTTTEDLQGSQTTMQETIDLLAALDAALVEKVGAGAGPDFAGLKDVCQQVKGLIEEQLARRGVGEPAAAAAEAATEDGGGGIARGRGGVIWGDRQSGGCGTGTGQDLPILRAF